jgi:hypothetical protein
VDPTPETLQPRLSRLLRYYPKVSDMTSIKTGTNKPKVRPQEVPEALYRVRCWQDIQDDLAAQLRDIITYQEQRWCLSRWKTN